MVSLFFCKGKRVASTHERCIAIPAIRYIKSAVYLPPLEIAQMKYYLYLVYNCAMTSAIVESNGAFVVCCDYPFNPWV